jgi:chemotaxis protein methyltransferase CheR/two-component system CheB/CheR fusion protein
MGAILGLVRKRTGVDFSRYRAATVERRIANRMISVGAGSYESYFELLQRSQDEARELLARISIKVSRFYRHRPTFDLLRGEVIPRLAAASRAPLRVWSAGCGCGEEPYTLAMLLEEAGVPGQVIGTDIDPAALGAAQVGLYPAEAAAELPPDLASRFLVPLRDGTRARVGVREVLRPRVRYVRHDLLFAAAPAGGPFDLVCCRNVLIYLQRPVRDDVFLSLRGAVRPGGFLCLGEAEWPPEAAAASLECLDHAGRVFRVRDSA